MSPELIVIIAVLTVVTYVTRGPLLIWLGRRQLPAWLVRCFRAMPIAVLMALAVPVVLLADGRLGGPWRPELAGAILAAGIARYTSNLLIPVGVAVVVVAGLRALMR